MAAGWHASLKRWKLQDKVPKNNPSNGCRMTRFTETMKITGQGTKEQPQQWLPDDTLHWNDENYRTRYQRTTPAMAAGWHASLKRWKLQDKVPKNNPSNGCRMTRFTEMMKITGQGTKEQPQQWLPDDTLHWNDENYRTRYQRTTPAMAAGWHASLKRWKLQDKVPKNNPSNGCRMTRFTETMKITGQGTKEQPQQWLPDDTLHWNDENYRTRYQRTTPAMAAGWHASLKRWKLQDKVPKNNPSNGCRMTRFTETMKIHSSHCITYSISWYSRTPL